MARWRLNESTVLWLMVAATLFAASVVGYSLLILSRLAF